MSSLRELYFKAKKELISPNQEIDIRDLLCHINKIGSLSDFYLHLDDEIQDISAYEKSLKSYLSGVPMAYLTNNASFCDLNLYVDQRVLIPRVETEEVVNYASKKMQEIYKNNPIVLADICSGSGCIGIALSSKNSVKKIVFTDISKDAIEVTKINAKKYLQNREYVTIVTNAIDIDEKLFKEIDVIVSNPPYILSKDLVDESVLKNEPHLALFTTKNLDVYDSIFFSVKNEPNKIKLMVLEIGEEIKDLLEEKIIQYFPSSKYEFLKDINGKYRMVGIIL